MKTRLTIASLLFLATLAIRVSAAEPGYVDFGKLTGPEKGEFVEVTLGKGMLKLAGIIVRRGDPNVGAVLAGLSRVRVNVVGLDDTNRADTTQRLGAVRQKLTADGWEQIVTARGKKHEDVVIFVKQGEGEAIEGIVVTVLDERKNAAVFVNVVGNIKPEQLAALGEHLQIEQLGLGAPKTRKS